VQGSGGSIAIFNYGGAGEMSDNTVSNASDAISANWSTGTKFLNNTIRDSASGIHTDNNGGSGGVADLIQGNTVKSCSSDGYAIFVFAPYVSATVESNRVKGCYIGLAAFGGSVSGQGPTFAENRVSGAGAITTDPNGTYAAYLTTDQLGFEFGDLTATLTGNRLEHATTGLLVTQTSPTPGQPAGGQATGHRVRQPDRARRNRRQRRTGHRRQCAEQLVGMHARSERRWQVQHRHRHGRIHALAHR
jgi:Periplasmic copper-binding protein (NosD)